MITIRTVITLATTKECYLHQMKNTFLSCEFEMTDMKKLHYFLGIEVIRTPKDIVISQCHYILNLLHKFGMMECKLVYPSRSKSKAICLFRHRRM